MSQVELGDNNDAHKVGKHDPVCCCWLYKILTSKPLK